MNPKEHYDAAERLLGKAEDGFPMRKDNAKVLALLAIGHALLAGLGDELVILERPDEESLADTEAEVHSEESGALPRAPKWMRGDK